MIHQVTCQHSSLFVIQARKNGNLQCDDAEKNDDGLDQVEEVRDAQSEAQDHGQDTKPNVKRTCQLLKYITGTG